MRIVVTGAGTSIGRDIVESLRRESSVSAIDRAMYRDRADAEEALASAAKDLGRIDAVAHVGLSNSPRVNSAFESLTRSKWTVECEEVLLSTLWVLQASFDHLQPGGGRIVVIVPSIGLTGKEGAVAACAAGEGQRSLVKSAARQWGARGITINCVAVPLEPGDGALGTTKSSLPSTDVGMIVGMLLSPQGANCTGQTIVVDDGTWMPT